MTKHVVKALEAHMTFGSCQYRNMTKIILPQLLHLYLILKSNTFNDFEYEHITVTYFSLLFKWRMQK